MATHSAKPSPSSSSSPFPFDTLEATFQALAAGPAPLALDGRAVGHGLPARLLPLDELRGLLLDPGIGFAARDAALAALVARAQQQGGAATVAVAGVVLPGLRRAIGPLAQRYPARIADLQAEALAGLIDALATFPAPGVGAAPGRPAQEAGRVAARLIWPAVRAAERLLARERGWQARTVARLGPAEPPRLAGHPDFVLARAVREGVLSAADAELIGETRVGGVRLVELARATGQPYKTLAKRRDRAERALVGWLVGTRMSNSGRRRPVSRWVGARAARLAGKARTPPHR